MQYYTEKFSKLTSSVEQCFTTKFNTDAYLANTNSIHLL